MRISDQIREMYVGFKMGSVDMERELIENPETFDFIAEEMFGKTCDELTEIEEEALEKALEEAIDAAGIPRIYIEIKEGPTTSDGLKSWYVLSDSEFDGVTEADMELEDYGVTAEFVEFDGDVARELGYQECAIFHEEI